MPLIAYLCPCGNSETKYHRRAKDAAPSLPCPKCNEQEMKKQLSAATFSSKVVIDNGHMARSVEVNPEIVEINKARSEKDYSKED